jgi:hypothetical protein
MPGFANSGGYAPPPPHHPGGGGFGPIPGGGMYPMQPRPPQPGPANYPVQPGGGQFYPQSPPSSAQFHYSRPAANLQDPDEVFRVNSAPPSYDEATKNPPAAPAITTQQQPK